MPTRIRIQMMIRLLAILALLAPATALAQAADSAVFVTRLGADTLVIERVVRMPGRVEADVLMRTPTTRRTKYTLQLTPAGTLQRMEAVTHDSASKGKAPSRTEHLTRAGDSLRLEIHEGSEHRVRTIAAESGTLPFIDMVHWPYEIALMRVRASNVRETPQPLLTGARVSTFTLARVGDDSITITHPTRGTMRARIDARGRLIALDAGETTRKLTVERKPWMNIDDIAARWMAQDAAGKSFGALSGRQRITSTVNGATISLDYGTPSKRGRAIWGALVPFGTVWRTGANMATHFETSHDLVFGSGGETLVVPAGKYTLFSVPERTGGWLIINKQTGQTGTAHDPSQDLGRVRLTMQPLDDPVEVFIIAADSEGERSFLRLQWDRAELVAPFRVRAK